MTHPAFKLMIVGRRCAGTTLAQHHHHILNIHGTMVVKYIAADPVNAPRRYAQNRVIDGSFRAGETGQDPFALNRDFVTQIWFDSPAQAMNSVQQPFYLQHLRPDEDRFVDQASVVKLAVREHPVQAVDASASASTGKGVDAGVVAGSGESRFKLFSFLTRSDGVDHARFLQLWQECGATLVAHAAAHLIQRHVQNEVLHRPGEPVWVDAVDEFWLPTPGDAAALANALQTAMVGPLLAAGALKAHSHFTLMAEEAVLFKGINS